jgi:hypothetical protein
VQGPALTSLASPSDIIHNIISSRELGCDLKLNLNVMSQPALPASAGQTSCNSPRHAAQEVHTPVVAGRRGQLHLTLGVDDDWNARAVQRVSCRNASLFERFPYVCPEPVLAT